MTTPTESVPGEGRVHPFAVMRGRLVRQHGREDARP